MPRIDTPATRQDVFAQYGRNIAQTMVDRKKASLPPFIAARSFGSLSADAAAPHPPQFCVKSTHEGVVPVGILGGGMAGLYAALMLAHHKDVGAMRFPLPKKGEIGPHLRLKQLFDYLKLPLFDYIYKNDTGLMYFNEVHSTIGDTEQRFRAKELNVPDPYIAAGVDVLCKDFIDPLAELLLSDMENGGDSGWKILKGQYDRYSTRSYLQFGYVPSEDLQTKYGIPGTGLPTSVINWMETFDKSSGWYDRALLETVLEALAFGAVGPTPDWHSVLPNATLAKIKELARDIPGMPSELIVMQSPVTSIVASDPDDKTSPLVVTAGGQQYTYSHVMSTVPLPNFALMNTSSLSMTVMQRNAIRQLQYGPSIKVGMLFKYPWWKDYKQVGGQSFTDLPVRTIVYPSYGDGQSSNVLIASYCWTNDAEKLGNLIGTGVDKLLDDLVLRNLATVHGVDVEFLRKQHVKTYSWNWNHNAWTGGAFAFFGPGQYDYLYNALNGTAADGRLQWAGELLLYSWIVGALDSAWARVGHRCRCWEE